MRCTEAERDNHQPGSKEKRHQVTINGFKRHEIVARAEGIAIDGAAVTAPRLVMDRGVAYNLGNLLRRLVLPLAIRSWTADTIAKKCERTSRCTSTSQEVRK